MTFIAIVSVMSSNGLTKSRTMTLSTMYRLENSTLSHNKIPKHHLKCLSKITENRNNFKLPYNSVFVFYFWAFRNVLNLIFISFWYILNCNWVLIPSKQFKKINKYEHIISCLKWRKCVLSNNRSCRSSSFVWNCKSPCSAFTQNLSIQLHIFVGQIFNEWLTLLKKKLFRIPN